MDAGKLRELITVQQKTVSGTGDRGQPVYTWTTFAQVYAEIEPLPPTGKKTEIARQLVATATHQFTIRYLTGLTPQMRIVDSVGNVYTIGYVAKGQDNLRYFFQTLLATQQTNGI
jgi:SPP1 family predicted phage head-tail adaptor